MNDFEILDKDIKDEEIDWLWGGQEYTITKEDIKALLNGQKLYGTVNDEYAFTIELEKEVSQIESKQRSKKNL